MVIITGIVVSLVGVTYFWGVPLIQKRSSMTEFQSMERFISELKEATAELARSGAGEVTIDIKRGLVSLLPYEHTGTGNNSLTSEFVLEQPLVFPGTTFYLGASSFVEVQDIGTYGEADPSVVKLTSEKFNSQYMMFANVRYRELVKDSAPKRGYVIALCGVGDDGCDEEIAGKQQVTLSFNRNVQRPGEASNGGDLVVTYIDVLLV
jgi:hypothetical protein